MEGETSQPPPLWIYVPCELISSNCLHLITLSYFGRHQCPWVGRLLCLQGGGKRVSSGGFKCLPLIPLRLLLSNLTSCHNSQCHQGQNKETFMAGIPKEQAARETLKINEQKWSKELMDAGWIAFPSILVEKQQALLLSPLDVNILLHLASYWWTAENKPYPSKKTIADALGVKPRTVQRRIAAMEYAKLIRREERRISKEGSKTNIYHFDGLIAAAKPFAEEKIKIREQRRAEDGERKARKRPNLRLVKSQENSVA